MDNRYTPSDDYYEEPERKAKPIAFCDCCDKEIFEGNAYYMLLSDNVYICENCADECVNGEDDSDVVCDGCSAKLRNGEDYFHCFKRIEGDFCTHCMFKED